MPAGRRCEDQLPTVKVPCATFGDRSDTFAMIFSLLKPLLLYEFVVGLVFDGFCQSGSHGGSHRKHS